MPKSPNSKQDWYPCTEPHPEPASNPPHTLDLKRRGLNNKTKKKSGSPAEPTFTWEVVELGTMPPLEDPASLWLAAGLGADSHKQRCLIYIAHWGPKARAVGRSWAGGIPGPPHSDKLAENV